MKNLRCIYVVGDGACLDAELAPLSLLLLPWPDNLSLIQLNSPIA